MLELIPPLEIGEASSALVHNRHGYIIIVAVCTDAQMEREMETQRDGGRERERETEGVCRGLRSDLQRSQQAALLSPI